MAPAVKKKTASRTKKRASPAEIAPGVFVGGWKDATAFQGDRFCVLDEAPDDMPPSTHIPIYDPGADAPLRPNLDRLADAVERARSRGGPVLIYCGMGVRRGSLGGAWYLHRIEGIPLEKAYDRVRAVRPQIETVREWVGHVDNLD